MHRRGAGDRPFPPARPARQAVTASRLIAEDTVDDKILALQDHKRALCEGLFAEDSGRLALLTAADPALLLAP